MITASTVRIRRARPDDASALAAFAARTFRATFGAENDVVNMDRYIAATYAEGLQRSELQDSTITTLLAEVDGALAGFAQLRSGEPPPCVTGTRVAEIWRLYVDAEWHGRGVAQSLMNAMLDAARARRAETVWLGVWERNPRARAFYEKSGFLDVGSHSFVLGDDIQVDRVMARSLRDPSQQSMP